MKRSKSDPQFQRKHAIQCSYIRANLPTQDQTSNVYPILLSHTSVTQSIECVINEKLQKMSTKDFALCIAQPPELVEIMPEPPALLQDESLYEGERFAKLLLRVRKAAKR